MNVTVNYQPIIDRRNELYKKSQTDNDVNLLMEMDCIDHLFGCEGFKTYEKIAEICKREEFETVFDIGCAMGHQSEIFKQNDIWYVGVDRHKSNFWNNRKYSYYVAEYPMKWSNTKPSDVAVSVLCLTWNCYLYDGIKTLHKQLKSLARDFKSVILYLAEDKVNIVTGYFDYAENVGNDLWLFKN